MVKMLQGKQKHAVAFRALGSELEHCYISLILLAIASHMPNPESEAGYFL
jgi:hypothetical protein